MWYSCESNRFCSLGENLCELCICSISGTCFCIVFKETITEMIGQRLIVLESVVKLLAYSVLLGFMTLNYYSYLATQFILHSF